MVFLHFLRQVRVPWAGEEARANEKHDGQEPIVLIFFAARPRKLRLFGCDHGVGSLLERGGVLQHPKRVQIDLQHRVLLLAFALGFLP